MVEEFPVNIYIVSTFALDAGVTFCISRAAIPLIKELGKVLFDRAKVPS